MKHLGSSTHLRYWVLSVLTVFLMLLTLSGLAFALTGDLDNDGDVDRDDLTVLLAHRNQPASTCPACDIDNDGTITVLDARKLVLQCTLPRCAIVSHENQPPIADANQDITLALPEGQTTVEVTLDGSQSNDPDGTVTGFTWTGTPDPEDVEKPVVKLKQGVYEFTLVVTDDGSANSPPDDVKVTVLGPPLIAPPPEVTGETTITIKGIALPGSTITLSNTGTGESKDVLNESGLFEVPMDLTPGQNEIQVTARIGDVQSSPVTVKVSYVATTALRLDSVSPQSAQTGSIITLTGSGFTPDKKVMGAYFKGSEYGSETVVLEASENVLKVMVPFVFLKSEEDVEVYVYDGQNMSNSISFHVVPAQDPTPGIKGNEAEHQLDLINIQLQNIFSKLEEWTKPNVPPEQWSLLEENMGRIRNFVDTLKDRVSAVPSEEIRSNLDAVFGSEFFSLINQKLESVNEILSHTSPCDINEVIGILNDVLEPIEAVNDILDTTLTVLYVGLVSDSVACFLGCVLCCTTIPFISEVIETVSAIDGVVDAIIQVVDTVVDVVRAAIPTSPSEWKVAVSGPFPGISNHILYTNTTSSLSLYANFTNAGFADLLKDLHLRIHITDPFGIFAIVKAVTGADIQSLFEKALGSLVVQLAIDLLDIDEIHITITDIQVSSTVESAGAQSPLTIEDEGSNSETHTITVGSMVGTDELDIQAACGNFEYPLRTKCESLSGDTCQEWGTDYPRYFSVEAIDVPLISQENYGLTPTTYWAEHCNYNAQEDRWEGCWKQRYDLNIEGKGFSASYGTYKVYWNGEIVNMVYDPHTGSFTLIGNEWGKKPGWISVAVQDEYGNERRTSPIFVPPSPDLDASTWVWNPSLYPEDTLYVTGDYFSPYATDIDLTLSYSSRLFSVGPFSQSWVANHTMLDILGFEVPDFSGYAYDGAILGLTLKVGESLPCQGNNCDQGEIKILPYESAGMTVADDQDMMVFGSQNSYLRSAAIGDLNGDGINDLVVGVPEYRNSGYAIGAVYIAFGPVEGVGQPYGDRVIDTIDLSTVNTSWDVKIIGDTNDIDSGGNSRRIGNSLAVGDVNGDGIDDLLVGTTDQDEKGEHRPNNLINPVDTPGHVPGKAYVFYGRPQWNADYNITSGEYDVKFFGDDDRELGYQVAIGNIYGFGGNVGYNDLVITAPTDSVDSQAPNQMVARTYIIHPGSISLPKNVSLPDDLYLVRPYYAVIEGQNEFQTDILDFQTGEYVQYKGDGLGKALALADINGDGRDDLLLGAPQYGRVPGGSVSALRQGAVYLFYGNPLLRGYLYAGSLSEADQDLLIEGPRIWSGDEKTKFGYSVTVADLDNDGKGEIIIGAPDAKLNLEMKSALLLDENLQSIAHIEETGIGRVYIVSGANTGLSGFTAIDGIADLIVNGSTSISRFGYSLASGDINNDGIDDLLVGAPGRPGTGTRGHVWAYYGSDSPFWVESQGQDLVQLQNRRRYAGEIDYSSDVGIPLEEGTDYLFVGSAPKFVDTPGFGTFVTAGDLNPYVGDDVMIIDPSADAPDAPFSSMLYVFYEGSTEFWPLTISPETATMNPCSGEEVFTINGGREPYQFNWMGCSQTSSGVLCAEGLPDWFDVAYDGKSVLLILNECVEENFKYLTLTVSDASGGEAYSQINFPRPELTVSPTSIDFGEIEIGQTVNGIITVSNTGDADLQISNISISGDMQQTNDCPAELPPGANCSITTTFAPSAEGVAKSIVTVESDDPYHPNAEVRLEGMGIVTAEPDIVVIGGNLVFSDVPTGAAGIQNITIKNSGHADLFISDIYTDGAPEFVITANTCTGTLPPQNPPFSTETCTITVMFTPTGANPVYGTITIESDDPDTPVFTGNLSGNGIGPFISVSPALIDFGKQSSESLLTIQNHGDSTLNWNIENNLPGWLSVSPMNGMTTAVLSTSLTVTTDRTGLDFGSYNHTLSIVSNGGHASVNVTMEVAGSTPSQKPILTVQPLSLDFGTTRTDDSFTIKNDGNAALTWDITANLPSWLSVSPMSGADLPAQETALSVSANRDGLVTGAYNHTILITSNDGNGSVEVSIEVAPQTSLAISPQNLSMNPCGDEHLFTATGGTAPYSFELVGLIGNHEAVPDVIDFKDNGNGTAVVRINPCGLGMDTDATAQDTSVSSEWIQNAESSDGYIYNEDTSSTQLNTTGSVNVQCGATVVTLKVSDSTGTEAETQIAFNLGQTGWAKTYGGMNFEDVRSIKQTSDGGYIIAGSTTSFGSGPLDYDFWVVKINAAGVLEWQKKFDFSPNDIVTTILETFDQQGKQDGYIIGGGDMISGNSNILKLHLDGTIEWEKSYKSDINGVNFMINAIKQTPDSGYIVAGTFSYEDEHIEILKLDYKGNIQWDKLLGEDYDSNRGADMGLTADGGYILIGEAIQAYGFSASDANIVVHKLDTNGEVQWALAYGTSTLNEYGTSIRQTFDQQGDPDGYIVAGVTESPTEGEESRDIWILKLENNGEIRWQKTIGGTGRDDTPSVSQTSDGGYIVSARTSSFGEQNGDFWIIKLNSSGEIEWQKTYGGSQMEQPYSIQQTEDGGYVIGGATRSFGSGDSDAWVLKLSPAGSMALCDNEGETPTP